MQNGHTADFSMDVEQQQVPPLTVQYPFQAQATKSAAVDYSHMIAVISTWKGILNARLLAVLSLLGTLGGFGCVMYDPQPLRLWGLGIYAVLCQAPVLALYLRKG